MALPLALSGLVTTKVTVGPFKSSAGNYYIFGGASSPTTTLTALKASDPTSSFSSIATLTGFTTAVQQLSGFQVSDVIHLAICDGSSTSLNQKYVQYNMATDTFGTVETIVSAVNTENSSSVVEYGNSLVVRSTGEVVAFFNGTRSSSIGGKHYARVYYSRRTGTNTWTAATEVDAGGATDYTQPSAGVDPSNNVDFIYANGGTELSSANALTTWIGTQSTTNDGYYIVEYASGANNEVGIYAGYSTNWIDAQSTGTAAAGNNPDSSATAPMRPFVDTAGPTCWVLYNKSNTLYVNSSTNDGVAWGTPVSVYSGTSISGGTALSVNGTIYQRGSNYVIPFVVSDNGTLYYDEYAVRAASTAWADSAALIAATLFGADALKLVGAVGFAPAATLSAAPLQFMTIGSSLGAAASLAHGSTLWQGSALFSPSTVLAGSFNQLMSDSAVLTATTPAAPSSNIGSWMPSETELSANLTALLPMYSGLVEQAVLGADLEKLLGNVVLSVSTIFGADLQKLFGVAALTISSSVGADIEKLLGSVALSVNTTFGTDLQKLLSSDQLQAASALGAQLNKLLGPALFSSTTFMGADLEFPGSGFVDNALLIVTVDFASNSYLLEVAAAQLPISASLTDHPYLLEAFASAVPVSAALNVNLINATILCCNYMTPEATFGADSTLVLPVDWSDQAPLTVSASFGADATKYWDNAYNRAYLLAEPSLLMQVATGWNSSTQLYADLAPPGILDILAGLYPTASFGGQIVQTLNAEAGTSVLSELSAQALKLFGNMQLLPSAGLSADALKPIGSVGWSTVAGLAADAQKLIGSVTLYAGSSLAAGTAKLLGVVGLSAQTGLSATLQLRQQAASSIQLVASWQNSPVLQQSFGATFNLLPGLSNGLVQYMLSAAGLSPVATQREAWLANYNSALAILASNVELDYAQSELFAAIGALLPGVTSLGAVAGKQWTATASLAALVQSTPFAAQQALLLSSLTAQATVLADLTDFNFILLEVLNSSTALAVELVSAEQATALLGAGVVLTAVAGQLELATTSWSGNAMLAASLFARRPDISEFTAASALSGDAKLAAVAYAVFAGDIVLPNSPVQMVLAGQGSVRLLPSLGATGALWQSVAGLTALSSSLIGSENLVESTNTRLGVNGLTGGAAALDMGANGAMWSACFMSAAPSIQRVIEYFSPPVVVAQANNTIIAQQATTSITGQGSSIQIISKGTIVITEE